jgi:hypothetical protein
MGSTPDPIEVIVRHDKSGKAYPLQLVSRGATHPVTDIGRRWQDDDGEHILVMLNSNQVCELLQDRQGCWFILPRPGFSLA